MTVIGMVYKSHLSNDNRFSADNSSNLSKSSKFLKDSSMDSNNTLLSEDSQNTATKLDNKFNSPGDSKRPSLSHRPRHRSSSSKLTNDSSVDGNQDIVEVGYKCLGFDSLFPEFKDINYRVIKIHIRKTPDNNR